MRNDHSIHWTWPPGTEYAVFVLVSGVGTGYARRAVFWVRITIVAAMFAIGYDAEAGHHQFSSFLKVKQIRGNWS